jgi:DNA modification methylase
MKLINADCIEAMKAMADNSVDAIVTDPPYELGFMGKSWDASGIAFNIEVWQEALRVIKPGGHLIAFSGSRTYHRMAVAIEDAGFQIRDQIMWVYGSGFPKSHNISKGIDKRGGSIPSQNDFGKFLQNAKSKTKFTIADINEALGRRTSNLWSHFVGEIQPLLPTFEQYVRLKEFLQFDNSWDHLFIDEAEREVIGSKKSGIGTAFGEGEWASGQAQDVDITAPATTAAQQWDGWGTALKPAHEPMVLARKPLEGTVANNVLTFGTGGLNIDATRVGSEGGKGNVIEVLDEKQDKSGGWGTKNVIEDDTVKGRFPANFIHDGSDEVVGLFPDSNAPKQYDKKKAGWLTPGSTHETNELQSKEYGDSGSAARFFYCAKASKKDRNEGLDGFEVRRSSGYGYDHGLGNAGEGMFKDRNPIKANHHPTVKPTTLMQYLVRLVTPPNGTVLDPFMGSGSTGKACAYEGFDFIGIDQSDEYVAIAQARINFALAHKDEMLEL